MWRNSWEVTKLYISSSVDSESEIKMSDKSLEAKAPVIMKRPETVDTVEIPENVGKRLVVEG